MCSIPSLRTRLRHFFASDALSRVACAGRWWVGSGNTELGKVLKMSGKVFLSCGQQLGRERRIAEKVSQLLKTCGFDPYMALDVQSVGDIMGIVRKLEAADYFLFIDFLRKKKDFPPMSLFSHQELALAHHLGFEENFLAFQEKGTPLDGFFKYVQSNPEKFSSETDLFKKMDHLLKKWSPSFSRHLVLSGLSNSGWISYKDHTLTAPVRMQIWKAEIINQRKDRAAERALCVLDGIEKDGKKIVLDDRAPLKWAEHSQCYEKTILPQDHGFIDLFSLRASGIFLHSMRDIIPRNPVVSQCGEYCFRYKLFSQGFPVLNFSVDVKYFQNATGVLELKPTIVKE